MKCVMCGKQARQEKVKLVELGVDFGVFDAFVCPCGERFYSENVMKKIQEAEKNAGIFGLEAETEVAQYGNSLAIRVKKEIADFLHLAKGKKVHVKPIDEKTLGIEVIG